ncbi:MAG: ATP-dependent DNA helicase [Clostridiales bacterium]|nr:ATP-dependent DNA helicase [Clostridiales bacterium]
MDYAHRINVRALAEFALEGGDLDASLATADLLLDGIKGHRLIQSAYPPGYRSEVTLSTTRDVDGMALRVHGRADGLWREGDLPVVEEIKVTRRPVHEINEGDDPAYWAQAELYAAIVAGNEDCPAVAVRLTYLNLSGDTAVFRRTYGREALDELFYRYAAPYVAWMRACDAWLAESRASFRGLAFPYDNYRAGQRELAVNAYVALREGKKLVCQAPTGIGKTVALLFPAVKAMGEGLIERAFYLTARGTGAQAAEDALGRMREKGLVIRSVFLTAKEKVCPQPEVDCRSEVCPRAKGYFDRRRAALYEALTLQKLDRAGLAALADRHSLCPFELALDASENADVIVGDYNYAFDPRVRLKRFFNGRTDSALLVDEAHNLPSRGRDMLSATVDQRDYARLRTAIGKVYGRKHPLYRTLTALLAALRALAAEDEGDEARTGLPEELLAALRAFADVAGPMLGGRDALSGQLADGYFAALDALRAADAFSDDYRTLIKRAGKGCAVTVWCADPAAHLAASMKRVKASALFSATLTPLPFYMKLLGVNEDDGDACLSVPSPFPPERLIVLRASLNTRYRQRADSAAAVARLIAAMAASRPGNYMACFPSHAYLRQVYGEFLPIASGIDAIAQSRDMDDAARAAFLARFCDSPTRSLVAFIAMGGVFSEGVDLVGERLTGAAIVGVGLPMVCLENEALAALFDDKYGDGFSYAYRYPGVTKVLQAAGRVIRTERDRGAVLLIDDRWARDEYHDLLPPHWQVRPVSGERALTKALHQFWRDTDE